MNKIPHKTIYNNPYLTITHNPHVNYLNFEHSKGKTSFSKEPTIKLIKDIMQHMNITTDDLK